MSNPKHAVASEPKVIAPGPESAAPRRPPRFPAFDGLRAIAAVTVVVVHVGFVSGLTPRNPHGVGMYTARLEIGVSVFFLISGFLLYRPFVVAHLAAAPRPRTGAFWLRRLLRIVPAYWLVLFIATSILHVGPGIGPGGWKAYASHYLFLQIYFPSQDLKGISAAWSLCVEMTFYLFIPLYAALIGWRRARRTRTPDHAARADRPGGHGGDQFRLALHRPASSRRPLAVLPVGHHLAPRLPGPLRPRAWGWPWSAPGCTTTTARAAGCAPAGSRGCRGPAPGPASGACPTSGPRSCRCTTSPTSTSPARPSTACSPSSCCCRPSSGPRARG